MGKQLNQITEAFDDGRFREEPRHNWRFAKCELPNYFDCLDASAEESATNRGTDQAPDCPGDPQDQRQAVNCVKCGGEIKALWEGSEQNNLWDSGAKGTIDAGYGSAYDTDTFEFVICDRCISEGMGEGTIKLLNR